VELQPGWGTWKRKTPYANRKGFQHKPALPLFDESDVVHAAAFSRGRSSFRAADVFGVGIATEATSRFVDDRSRAAYASRGDDRLFRRHRSLQRTVVSRSVAAAAVRLSDLRYCGDRSHRGAVLDQLAQAVNGGIRGGVMLVAAFAIGGSAACICPRWKSGRIPAGVRR
jgi:hypothetical protein